MAVPIGYRLDPGDAPLGGGWLAPGCRRRAARHTSGDTAAWPAPLLDDFPPLPARGASPWNCRHRPATAAMTGSGSAETFWQCAKGELSAWCYPKPLPMRLDRWLVGSGRSRAARIQEIHRKAGLWCGVQRGSEGTRPRRPFWRPCDAVAACWMPHRSHFPYLLPEAAAG